VNETYLPVRALGWGRFSTANWDTFRFQTDDEGHLEIAGRDGWQEPICPICNEPIRWCLDMFSFTTGPRHRLAHARCVWTAEAFELEARRMLELEGTEA
jgi:hypothetical protein